MTFDQGLQLLQTISVICAILVAAGTLKGRSDTKTIDMAELKIDIKYIKELVAKIPAQATDLALLRKDLDTLGKKFEEHMRVHNRGDGQ